MKKTAHSPKKKAKKALPTPKPKVCRECDNTPGQVVLCSKHCPVCDYGQKVGWPTCKTHSPALRSPAGLCACRFMSQTYGKGIQCGVCRYGQLTPDQLKASYYEGVKKDEERYTKILNGRGGIPNIPPEDVHRSRPPTSVEVKVQNLTPIPVRVTEGQGGGRRYTVWDYPLTYVVRWMGRDAWTAEDAEKVIRKLGIDINESTLTCQLVAGRRGTRGDPAKLTAQQSEQLYGLLEVKKVDPPPKKIKRAK